MEPDRSFDDDVGPEMDVGHLIFEMLAHLGYDQPSMAAYLRNFVTRLVRHSSVLRLWRTLVREILTSRSLVRALANTFPIPVGDVFVDLKPFIRKKQIYQLEDADDLWDNADMVESGCCSSASDDLASLNADTANYSVPDERVGKLEAEVAFLKTVIMNYYPAHEERHSAASEQTLNRILNAKTSSKKPDLRLRSAAAPPPPPAPPLPPNFNIPTRTAAYYRNDSVASATNSLTSELPVDNVTNSKPKFVDIFSEMPHVRLKPVHKSPGGTPMLKRRQPATEMESILCKALANVRNAHKDEDTDSERDIEDSWSSSMHH